MNFVYSIFLLQELTADQQNILSFWSQKYNVLVQNIAHYEIINQKHPAPMTSYLRQNAFFHHTDKILCPDFDRSSPNLEHSFLLTSWRIHFWAAPEMGMATVTWPPIFWALNANSSKTVKATDFKFYVRATRDSSDVTLKFFWKGRGQGHVSP